MTLAQEPTHAPYFKRLHHDLDSMLRPGRELRRKSKLRIVRGHWRNAASRFACGG